MASSARDPWFFQKSIPHPSFYPIITNVQATSLGVITWTTDVASTSQVEYGILPAMGSITDRDNTLVTSHSIALPSLPLGTVYYRVQSFYYDSLSISVLFSFQNVAEFVGHEEGTLDSLLLEDGSSRFLLEV